MAESHWARLVSLYDGVFIEDGGREDLYCNVYFSQQMGGLMSFTFPKFCLLVSCHL
ncbi:hypothetical protein B7P43_G04534 [Cryptotermes secundus]|uniref:Uncharacterized protein n=1 Tax=Cryptotermes secundus TaxID=105785 RepID=A0A2J7QLI5_9NEOP|nr:hypothetical protein B7P43_G04534 [Cryptotermes secundus]